MFLLHEVWYPWIGVLGWGQLSRALLISLTVTWMAGRWVLPSEVHLYHICVVTLEGRHQRPAIHVTVKDSERALLQIPPLCNPSDSTTQLSSLAVINIVEIE